ncbi:MAG: hypothetical protein HY928_06665 [Elusimicrobia bacterium]|nr:hypothetical protein [Elusimicrobiota bacterium]
MANSDGNRERDLILYKPLRVVEPYEGFCGTGCAMTVLNHFLGTSFSAKDSLDVLALIKGREVGPDDAADEIELARFLGRMGLAVTLYGYTPELMADYVRSPAAFLRRHGIAHYPKVDFGDSTAAARAVLGGGSGMRIGGLADPWNVISAQQAAWRLFIVGGDYYVFRDEEHRRQDEHAGHLTVCSGTRGTSFVIHDPGPYAIHELAISRRRMRKSTTYYGGAPTFIMIEHERWQTILSR